MTPRHTLKPARKVFTESMIRKVLGRHFEVESDLPLDTNYGPCDCGWEGSNFEDHFIDQLHKLWHETVGRRRTATNVQMEQIYTSEEIEAMRPSPSPIPYVR